MAKAWFEATVTKRFKGIINDNRLALHEGESFFIRKYGKYGVLHFDGGSCCGTFSANFARQHLRLGKRLSEENSARLEERVQAILRERAQRKNPSAFSAAKKYKQEVGLNEGEHLYLLNRPFGPGPQGNGKLHRRTFRDGSRVQGSAKL